MSVGTLEIAFLAVATVALGIAAVATKRRWLAAFPLFFVVAALVSPADLMSTLLIAIPNCALGLGLVWFAAKSEAPENAAAS